VAFWLTLVCLYGFTYAGVTSNDGSCGTDLASLISTMTTNPSAQCKKGVWTVTGTFQSNVAWWCFDPIVINGDFIAASTSLVQFVLNPDNVPGSSITISGQGTFGGTIMFFVATPASGNYDTNTNGVQYIFLVLTGSQQLVAPNIWQPGQVSWKDYNGVNPCYRTGLVPRGQFIDPNGLHRQDTVLQLIKGDCNTPTINTGLFGPPGVIPPATPTKPGASPVPGAKPTKPPKNSPVAVPGSPSPGKIPDGAVAGIIILVFLILIVVIGTLVFVCVKSSKSKVDEF